MTPLVRGLGPVSRLLRLLVAPGARAINLSVCVLARELVYIRLVSYSPQRVLLKHEN